MEEDSLNQNLGREPEEPQTLEKNRDLSVDMEGSQEPQRRADEDGNDEQDGNRIEAEMVIEGDPEQMGEMEEEYGDENFDEDGMPVNTSQADLNQEELEAIIESISSGKSQQYKKLQFQAFCAAISHEDQVRFVIDYLCNVSNPKASSKFATAKNRILAYRVSQMDPVQQKTVLAEGFDDDGEDGSGDKLLTVLQKMDIGNIMVVVCIWNSGVTIGDNRLRGGEFFRMITDRARELLTSIKEGVEQADQEEEKGPSPPASPRKAGTQAMNYDLLNVQKHPGMQSMTQKTVVGAGPQSNQSAEKLDEQILSLFKSSLSKEDMAEAQNEISEALTALTKAAILELRSMTKPNILIEKTLQIVTALRGFKHINWNTAKEMLGKPSFKIDLMQLNPKMIRPANVLQAQKILTQKTNTMLTPENVQLHSEGAALLLIWGANMIKLYACHKKLNPKEDAPTKPLRYEDLQRISNRTRVQLKKNQIQIEADTKDAKKKAIQFKNTGLTSVAPIKTKPGNIGHFVQSKTAIFDTETAALKSSLVNEQTQKEVKMVDLSVIKKGLNFHGTAQKNLEKEHMEMKREEERMEREQAVMNKTSRSFKDDSTSAKNDTKQKKEKEEAKQGEQDDAQEGVLKMVQVQNLPEDVEMIVGQMKTLDFSKQDLDVLIELSKQLKYKRVILFPDTSYMQSLQEAGLTPEQIMKDTASK